MKNTSAGTPVSRYLSPPDSLLIYMALLGYCLAAFSVFRLIFLLKYHALFSGLPCLRIVAACVRGIRFDASTLAAALGPFFLILQLLPPRVRTGRLGVFVRTLPVIPLWACIFLVFFDLYYYGEMGRRFSYEIFIFFHDVGAVWGIIASYPVSLAIWVAVCALFLSGWLWIARAAASRARPSRGILHEGAFLLVFVAFSIIAGRGGLQPKPLRPSYAFADDSVVLGHLALNAPFTTAHTVAQGESPRVRYYPDEDAVSTVRSLLHEPPTAFPDPRYPLMHTMSGPLPVPAASQGQKPNIVIILEESWAAKFSAALGATETVLPHFDRLAADGILFTRFYANGQRSIEGMACVCCAIPSFRDTILIGGSLEQHGLRCVGHAFKDAGYSTVFIHGAKTGSFGFDAFSRRAGFDRYIGKEDFRLEKEDFDPVWGVYDHVALGRANTEFARMKEPFLAVWFSLSAHAPFHLPASWSRAYPGDRPEGDLRNSILYADASLAGFFEAARKEKYFRNTIFVILSDHSAGSEFTNTRERFHIPLLLYAPALLPPGRRAEVGSQIDLLPTLLDLAGIRTTTHSFGQSLLRPPSSGRSAFLDSVDTFGWIRDNYFLISDTQKMIALYEYASDPDEQRNLLPDRRETASEMYREMRSFIQVSKALILDNRLYPSRR